MALVQVGEQAFLGTDATELNPLELTPLLEEPLRVVAINDSGEILAQLGDEVVLLTRTVMP